MSARRKLNASHINGVLLVAGVVGVATGSWMTAAVVAGALVVSGIVGGGIRLWPRKRK